MPKDKIAPIRTIREELAQLHDTGVRDQALLFVTEFDLRKIETQKELAAGFQGALAMAMTLGPRSKELRETVHLIVRILEGYAKTMKSYLDTEFPKEIKKILLTYTDNLKDKLPAEDYKQLKELIFGL